MSVGMKILNEVKRRAEAEAEMVKVMREADQVAFENLRCLIRQMRRYQEKNK
jgi:hypothetical protein